MAKHKREDGNADPGFTEYKEEVAKATIVGTPEDVRKESGGSTMAVEATIAAISDEVECTPRQSTAEEPGTNDGLPEGPFWDLLVLACYTSWWYPTNLEIPS